MSDCAECHIGGPDCLPGDPLCGVGRRDDVIAAFINGDVIDVTVRVRIHVEEDEIPTPRLAFTFAMETEELCFRGPGD